MLTRFKPRATGLFVCLIGATAIVFAGCGSDSKSSSTSAASSTAANTKPAVVHVTASDFAFDLPSSIPSGVVEFQLENQGKQAHDFQLAAIDGNHSLDEIKNIVADQGGPTPDWLHGAGGVGTVAPGAPMNSAFVQIDAGKKYVYFCTESDDAGHPHVTMGMLGAASVSGTSPANDLPTATATVTAREYTFEVSGVHAGQEMVKFTNAGPAQLHHFVAFPLNPGATIDQVQQAFASQDQSGPPPPVDFTKSIEAAVLDPGQSEVLPASFTPGQWVFVCFMSDRAGGPPHVAKGMITEFAVS